MRSISFAFKELAIHQKHVIGFKKHNKWLYASQNNMHELISGAKQILQDRNIKKGDRVLYKGNNSKEWLAWNLATNSIGAIWVPMYKEQTFSHIKHIQQDCTPKLFISDNEEHGSISNKIEPSSKDYDITENDICTLVYTSGTSGAPKGVMLTNDNIMSNVEAIHRRFIDHKDLYIKTLNILPWAHIFGLTTELYYNILHNNCVNIAESKEKFVSNLREIQPDYIYVVPKVLCVIKKKLDFLEKLPFSNFSIPKALHYIFGPNIKAIFVGGAKLDSNVAKFYEKYGIKPCEGYGATETSPVVSVNHFESPRNTDSVGKILDNVKVKIIDKEIYVGGPSIMKGYWNNINATKKVLIPIENEIYYKTGDGGKLCNENYLYFEGRKSDNYKLSNGKFVDVHALESVLKKHISGNFIVYGENMDHNVILTDQKKCELHTINQNIDSYLRIKNVIHVDTSIFEKHMTPKLSIKRHNLIKEIIQNS